MPQFLPPNPRDHDLHALLARRADVLAPLLGPLWPIPAYKKEVFGSLVKYTIGQLDGRWVMLHHITQPDQGPPHCHPCEMHSYGIEGRYLERIYKDGCTREVMRRAGSNHLIAADCIHKLLALPDGWAWTLVLAGPVVRDWRHYPELV